jgi:class I fructose-bisphosphate aldolase
VTIQADIIKQKLPECNNGYEAVAKASGHSYGKTDKRVYSDLTTDHPIDLTRYQVLNCYAGRMGLINSGGCFREKRFCRSNSHGGNQQARWGMWLNFWPQNFSASL